MAARRWLLFGLALGSLVLMTWAGVLLAFSVPLDESARAENPEAGEATRAIVVPANDLAGVATFASGREPVLLAAGTQEGSFPVSAQNVSLGRALARVTPTENGSYEPATLELADVPTTNGTTNLTLDVAALAGGASGFVVLSRGEAEPRFVSDEQILGEVAAFESTTGLWTRFGMGLLGFLAPLVVLVVTHKGGRRAGAGEGAGLVGCRECRAPLPPRSEFCTRCGAWTKEA